MNKFLLIFLVFGCSCNTGNLKVIADLPKSLKETSAVEITPNSDLLWVIEDAGNKNVLYGLDDSGKITKKVKITNAENIDWEDLASDSLGNIYIGDFGNNSKNRITFTILKIEHSENRVTETTAKSINFTLPKDTKPKDFEAFFLFKNDFYIFSKNDKRGKLFKIPNTIGNHEAVLITDFNLKGKNNAITSADYYQNQIVLLNHEKVWLITNFKNNGFFKGDIRSLEFGHKSKKEGVCFKNDSTLIITDEYTKKGGGNIYEFGIN